MDTRSTPSARSLASAYRLACGWGVCLALTWMPINASAVNCDFGCKGSNCHIVVSAAGLASTNPIQYQYGHATALPPLSNPAPPGVALLSDICDQLVTSHHTGGSIVNVERAIAAQHVHRQRVDFDLSGVQAYVYPGNGQHSWWHGIVTWTFAHQPNLSVDYTGRFDSPWLHYQNRLRVRLDQEVIAEINPSTPQIAVELLWGSTGPLTVVIAEFAGTPALRKSTPTQITQVQVPDTEGLGLVPVSVAIGRTGNGPELASTGVLSAASNLVLPLSPQ